MPFWFLFLFKFGVDSLSAPVRDFKLRLLFRVLIALNKVLLVQDVQILFVFRKKSNPRTAQVRPDESCYSTGQMHYAGARIILEAHRRQPTVLPAPGEG